MKKRFIAGAVCPRCAEMDKIIMYEQHGKNFRECVNCDYKDEMLLSGGASEINTRVNDKSVAGNIEEQVIKIFDTNKQ